MDDELELVKFVPQNAHMCTQIAHKMLICVGKKQNCSNKILIFEFKI